MGPNSSIAKYDYDYGVSHHNWLLVAQWVKFKQVMASAAGSRDFPQLAIRRQEVLLNCQFLTDSDICNWYYQLSFQNMADIVAS